MPHIETAAPALYNWRNGGEGSALPIDKETSKLYADWNPWHGCTKISAGCRHCYVYRQDEMYSGSASSRCSKNAAFDLPLRRGRDGQYKIPSGKIVFTCFTSDFLLADADDWRPDCWRMMRRRSDCLFYFFTKRIDRLERCLPTDWGDGYPNVLIGCSVENQAMADHRLPIFQALPIKHRSIIAAPLLERIDILPYLNEGIEEVSAGGESGTDARPCDYDWILALRAQCVAKDVPFRFHQTGANFVRDGKHYRVPRRFQHTQARKAGIDYRVGADAVPESVVWPDAVRPRASQQPDPAQFSFFSQQSE